MRVAFRYLKGHRDPYSTRHVEYKRIFTFLPTRGHRFEFDLCLILLKPSMFRTFCSADQARSLDPNQQLSYSDISDKLKEMCLLIGLYKRNTFYSFRRTAIVETRRSRGSEAAASPAGYKDLRSLFYYDLDDMADVDLTSFSSGQEGGVSRELRRYFSQVSLARYQPADRKAPDLKQAIKLRVEDELRNNVDYIQAGTELEESFVDAHCALQPCGVFSDNQLV